MNVRRAIFEQMCGLACYKGLALKRTMGSMRRFSVGYLAYYCPQYLFLVASKMLYIVLFMLQKLLYYFLKINILPTDINKSKHCVEKFSTIFLFVYLLHF